MNEKNKKILLKTAKKSITAALAGTEKFSVKSTSPELNSKCGCFVTIKNGNDLRGCLGQFTSNIPIIELVSQMAQASATSDYRFAANPITPDELDQLHIEISVLSPLQKAADPLSLELGKHGIYIKNKHTSGCFLPQVALETGWSKDEFLSYCCSEKAGLHPNSWKQSDTDVYLFTADIFGDHLNDI